MNISKWLRQASPEIKSWLNSLSRKKDVPVEELVERGGERLENLDLMSPESLDLYEAEDLFSVLSEANQGSKLGSGSHAAMIAPEKYRESVAKLTDDRIRYQGVSPAVWEEEGIQMTEDKVGALKNLISNRIPLGGPDYPSGVPFMGFKVIDMPDGSKIVQVTSHDARHRVRALGELGHGDVLVNLSPDSIRDQILNTDLKKLPPDTPVYSELSQMQGSDTGGGQKVGTIKELFKFLTVPAVATTGALSQLPEE
jgi:hypothetical protein